MIMQDDTIKPFQISFWVPCRWERNLLEENNGLVDQERFLEEVYTWVPAEPIWNSIIDNDATELLRKSLLDDFSPDKSPKMRKIEDFLKVLEQIKKIVEDKKSEWIFRQQLDDGNDTIDLYANLLLSFMHHLTWICDMFRDVPGISITVR
jgi:hypothetical protein